MPALNKTTLTQQVDLPTWEWTRFAPAVSSAVSSSCSADNGNFLPSEHGRYIYYLISATNFSRYDTWTDMFQQLQSPPIAPVTFSAMKFAGALGPEGKVIAATSTTLQLPALTQGSMVGYDVVIVSGTGAGQRRTITAVAEPVIHDSGIVTAVANALGGITLTDTLKSFTVNQYEGYAVRVANTPAGSAGQIRRILSNAATVLTVGDTTQMNKPWHNPAVFAPAISATAGSQTAYAIESQVVTVDSAWATTPDATSVFRIQSGMVLCGSGAAAAPFHTLQGYCILTDAWYVLPAYTNNYVAALTDFSIERTTENSSIWERGTATGGSTTTLVDAAHGVDAAAWRTNQWAGYWVFVYSGTAAGQIRQIASNTGTTLTWSTAGTAPDTTSRYLILGFDAGTATAGAASTLTDSTKAWATNRWANYDLRILHGTGRGQTRTIASNTATVITTLSPWDTVPDNTSVFVIQGDSDKLYLVSGGNAAILMHNMDSMVATFGRQIGQVGWGIARNAAATVGGHLPVAIASLSNVTTTATVTTAHPHQFRVGELVTVRGATDANYNVTAVAIATVPSATTFTYTMAGTPSGNTLTGSQSTTTLTDLTKNWTTNEHAGRLVYMNTGAITAASGSAAGQVVRIASNTATTLTFAATVTAPTNGVSRYSIARGDAIGTLDFGVATGAGQSTTAIADSSKSWAVNIWAGRRVRVLTSGGPIEVIIASNTATVLTVATITLPVAAVTQYVILEGNAKGVGTNANWAFGTSNADMRGRYMWIARGGGLYGFERVDLTTDRIRVVTTSPLSETLTTGSMTAYDGQDRIYFHKDATQRVMSLDVVTGKINGASMYPYAAPTAVIGNRMEVFTTKDGLKYIWLNRASFAECFRCLAFW
jgi:hypothetical protein